jgi:outer membrane protein assembly factor BamE (lipoprotein component of BamABCDE complex)
MRTSKSKSPANLSALLALTLVGLLGCAATPEKMVALQMGMNRAEVVQTMGSPTSVSKINESEYLNYNFCVNQCAGPIPFRQFRPFYVRLINGKVESFGEKGDFDSTKTPSTRIEIDKTERSTTVNRPATQEADMFAELKKLKELLDAGIVTQAEFDARKKLILAR